jgi:Skp family chaperone for outer membrane proteins
MKSIFLALLLMAAMATQSPAMAESKIAVVNIQEVLRNSSAAKDASGQLESLRSTYQGQFKNTEEQLRAEDQKMGEQRASLSAEEFQAKRQEFRKKVVEKTREFDQKRAGLDRGYAKAMAQIQQKILEISKSLAEAKSYDIVVPTSQILYAKTDMDITADVTAKLNEAMPSLKVEISN